MGELRHLPNRLERKNREDSGEDQIAARARELQEEFEAAAELFAQDETRKPLTAFELMSEELVRTQMALEDARTVAGLKKDGLTLLETEVSELCRGLIYLRSVTVRLDAEKYARERNRGGGLWKFNLDKEMFLAKNLAGLLVEKDVTGPLQQN